jgi:molybdopterin-guanine dinucleotide biosynthesis protein A
MSQSKLLIHIGGKLVLARIADTLKMVCSELVLVVRPDQDDDVPDLGIALNMHVVTDTQPYEGPLAGIHAGLAASHTPLNFVGLRVGDDVHVESDTEIGDVVILIGAYY